MAKSRKYQKDGKRRHHNNTGYRTTKRGKRYYEVKAMARRLFDGNRKADLRI